MIELLIVLYIIIAICMGYVLWSLSWGDLFFGITAGLLWPLFIIFSAVYELVNRRRRKHD